MAYIIQMTNPQGVKEYMPENFGFGVHEHTNDINHAWRFTTREAAGRVLQGYINPPAFWESERRYRDLQRQKFKNWKCEVVSV